MGEDGVCNSDGAVFSCRREVERSRDDPVLNRQALRPVTDLTSGSRGRVSLVVDGQVQTRPGRKKRDGLFAVRLLEVGTLRFRLLIVEASDHGGSGAGSEQGPSCGKNRDEQRFDEEESDEGRENRTLSPVVSRLVDGREFLVAETLCRAEQGQLGGRETTGKREKCLERTGRNALTDVPATDGSAQNIRGETERTHPLLTNG
jgi:hypothetical protein